MKDTLIYQTLYKAMSHVLDIEYYTETLFSFPENEWFYPTNGNGNEYAICDFMHSINLIEQKRTPIWVNGSLRGVKVAFRYNKQMNYTGEIF